MKKLVNKNPRELSFTIFETIVAVGLLMAFTLEIAGGQGNIINKVEYARRSNDAIWLAKRIMSQVEYNYQTMDLKDLETTSSMNDQKFVGLDNETDFDYLWSVEVKEWKFPLFDFLLKGGTQGEENKNDPTKPDKQAEGAGIPGIDAILDQIFKGHIMKIAHVEVSWPEGARRDSVRLTYLLTNTKALDEYLGTKKSVFDKVISKASGAGAQQGISPTGPICTPAEPPESRNAPGNGGCIYPDETLRTPDGSRYSREGELISKPQPSQPPPPPPPPPGPPQPNLPKTTR